MYTVQYAGTIRLLFYRQHQREFLHFVWRGSAENFKFWIFCTDMVTHKKTRNPEALLHRLVLFWPNNQMYDYLSDLVYGAFAVKKISVPLKMNESG